MCGNNLYGSSHNKLMREFIPSGQEQSQQAYEEWLDEFIEKEKTQLRLLISFLIVYSYVQFSTSNVVKSHDLSTLKELVFSP